MARIVTAASCRVEFFDESQPDQADDPTSGGVRVFTQALS
jgi:hypothetical protein